MMTRLETPLETFKQHFSPLICTFFHFIRKPFACKWFDTIFFNEINDLDTYLKVGFN